MEVQRLSLPVLFRIHGFHWESTCLGSIGKDMDIGSAQKVGWKVLYGCYLFKGGEETVDYILHYSKTVIL